MSSEVEREKIDQENFQVESMYTTLSEAKAEVWKRWNDKELRKKVEEYLGEIPEVFRHEPRAAISRSIITPNQELFYFLDLAESVGLKPIGFEGVEDKFCTKNLDKVSLGKLSFCGDVKSGFKESYVCKKDVSVIDLMKSDGKRFCDIETLWGENLVDFHHRLLKNHNSGIETFDDFKWFTSKNKKNSSNEYYDNFLSFFLCYGILFENFHANGKEKSFTDEVIVSSFKKIEELFNIKPLIVPLVPIDDEKQLRYWNSYHYELYSEAVSDL